MTEKTHEPLLLEPREVFDQFLIGLEYEGKKFIYNGDQILEYLIQEAKEAQDTEDPELNALDHFHFNILGSYMGPGTPIFITKYIEPFFNGTHTERLPKIK